MGLAGWQIAKRLHFPAATVLGPMILVGAAASLGLVDVALPVWLRLALQMTIGSLAGYRLDQEAARRIRRMGRPLLVVTAWTIGSALLAGYLLHTFTGIDWPTAFLGTAPGGLPEMSAMALTMQANVAMVATLGSARLLTTMLAIPFLARRLGRGERAARLSKSILVDEPATQPASTPGSGGAGGSHWTACLAIGVTGGLLFYWLQLPAAGVMGSILFVAFARIGGIQFRRPPDSLRTVAQLGIGIFIGTTFSPQTAIQIASNFLPVIGTAVALVASGLVLAGALQRTLGLDSQTALLACSPAGLTQMAALSEELGSQTFIVSIFQLTRMLTVVLVLPIIFRLLIPQ
jgi:hypothetical protein